jgi:hypothetical protein
VKRKPSRFFSERGCAVDGNGVAWARVVYCRAVSGKAFSVGLNLLTQTSDWEVRSISSAFKQQK